MEYLNFDLEIQPGNGGFYPLLARSNAGSKSAMMRFPFDAPALDNALLRVQNALLRSAALRRQVLAPEAQAVQDFGQRLFMALLTGEVLQLYDASGALAAQQGKGLRVRLQVLAPELAALPWEFLYDPRQGDYLCFLSKRSMVRYLDVPQPVQPLSVDPPLRVLAMVASPSDQAQLDVEYEKRRLAEALAPLETQRGLLKLRWVPGQTWRDLQQMLWQRDWHIFHFIGHGAFDPRIQEGVVALANEQGGSHLLSATDLGRLLSQRTSLRLTVLNACQGATANKTDLFSSTAATLIRKGLPAVLAMQYEITDQAAIEFTRGFYGALAAGIPVDDSLTQARTSISLGLTRSLEWVTPVLYMRSPDGVLFDMASSSTIIPAAEQQPRTAPPPTGTPAGPARRPDAPPPASAPSSWPPPPQTQWKQGYAGPPVQMPGPGLAPATTRQASIPAPRSRRFGRGLAISLVIVIVLAAIGGAGFAVFKLASGISFPTLPGFGGSSSQFHVTPTSLSRANCTDFSSQLDCQVTLVNDDTSQQLNWNATTTDRSITFEPNSSGFVTGGGSWTVTVAIPTNPCPASATLAFSGGGKSIQVPWSCT